MGNVGRGGVLEHSMTAVGQDRIGESPVGGIRFAADQASILESFDDARQAGQRRIRQHRKGAHPHRVLRAAPETRENLVLDHRQVGITLELLINRPGELGHKSYDGKPRIQLIGREPLDGFSSSVRADSLAHTQMVTLCLLNQVKCGDPEYLPIAKTPSFRQSRWRGRLTRQALGPTFYLTWKVKEYREDKSDVEV
jgi:hypothetical protein